MKSVYMRLCAFLFSGMALASGLYAQDFGFDNTWGAVSAPVLSVKVGGEIGAFFTGYVHDFSSRETIEAASLGDVVQGALNVSASGAKASAFIALNLSAASINGSNSPIYTPLILDEAYLRAYLGPVNIAAGLRKLSWGKADSLGPLDVINPMDYTDLRNMDDIQKVKIARPLVHAAWNTGGFSKLEAVFIPNFASHRFAQEGRWTPALYSTMAETAGSGILEMALQNYPAFAPFIQAMYPQIASGFSGYSPELPDTSGLNYFQTGLRYTATIGPADIGAQYFYGNLFLPDVTITGTDEFFNDLIAGNSPPNPADPYLGNTDLLLPLIKYSRYHQIGIDYAQVLFDFNVRAEFAVYLTEDLKGDDGSVRNPFLAWSLGFDRYLFWGIDANIQCNETIRLLNDKVGNNPILDCEADTNVTSTRLTLRLSRKFLMDELESRATVIWDIENSDCYIIPAIVWAIGDINAELSAGIFAGKKDGELGQYWENSFVRLGLKYSF